MPTNNGRGRPVNERDNPSQVERSATGRDEALIQDEDVDPTEYDTMLTLERLESLEEEMVELNVKTLDDVRRKIAELHQQLDNDLTP